MKCDVEGFELKVLKGATNLLSSEEPPIIMIEINEKLSKTAGYAGIEILRFIFEISNGRYSFYRISKEKKRLCEYSMNMPLKRLENILCVVKDIHAKRLSAVL